MELLPLIVIVGIVVLFTVSNSRTRNTPSSSTSASEGQTLPATRPVASVRTRQHKPFDATTAEPSSSNRVVSGAVYVTDGDTIKIKNTQIRMFGIDAPELNHPYGQKAKWALHKLCKGQRVRAEIKEVDAHGRTVAQCFLPDGRDLSAEMVKRGLAIDWSKFSGGKYRPLEPRDARKRLFLADARQKGRMHVWERFEERQARQ